MMNRWLFVKVFFIIALYGAPVLYFSQIKPVAVITQVAQGNRKKQRDLDPLDSFKNLIYSEIVNCINLSSDKLPVAQFTFNVRLDKAYQVESMLVSINANDSLKTNLKEISRRLDFTDLVKMAKEMEWANCDILLPFIVFYETDKQLSFIDSGTIASGTLVNSFAFDNASFATRKSIVLKPKILGFGRLIR